MDEVPHLPRNIQEVHFTGHPVMNHRGCYEMAHRVEFMVARVPEPLFAIRLRLARKVAIGRLDLRQQLDRLVHLVVQRLVPGKPIERGRRLQPLAHPGIGPTDPAELTLFQAGGNPKVLQNMSCIGVGKPPPQMGKRHFLGLLEALPPEPAGAPNRREAHALEHGTRAFGGADETGVRWSSLAHNRVH